MNDLSQRLKDGVPTPPDLSGVAARSAHDGHRRRTRRRLAAVAAVVVLAAGGVVLPRMLSGGPPDVAERSEPQCVSSAEAPPVELGRQPATWVRFCRPADEGATRQARVPDGAVTGSLAAAVVQAWADRVVDRECRPESPPVPSRLFRIQVGLADGGVAEIAGDTGCVDDHLLFMQMETPLLGRGGTRRDEVVEPRPVTCPDDLTTTETNADGADADLLRVDADGLSTVPLLPGRSTAIDVCAYTGVAADRTLVDQWSADDVSDLRGAATTGYSDGEADCGIDPGATSYVVVMHDLTGTARTFTIDMAACGAMRAAIGTPAVDTRLGLASPGLVRQVRDSGRS